MITDRQAGAVAWRRAGIGAVMVSVALLGGCAHTHSTRGLDRHEARWRRTAPTRYSFIYQQSGSCGSSRWAVSVRDGRTTLAQAGGSCPILGYRQVPRSMAALFAIVRGQARHADHVSIRYDRTYGFPTLVEVDPDRHAIDDEHGISVSGFRAGAAADVSPVGWLTGRVLLVGGPLGAAPRPVTGRVTATSTSTDGLASSAMTDRSGHFDLHLVPGRYHLTAHSPSFGNGSGACTAAVQRVRAGSVTTAMIDCPLP